MDKIHLNHMAFFAYHGNLSEEATLGQKFFIDLEIGLNLRPAGRSDKFEDTLCYGEIFNLVRDTTEKSRFNIIEALGERIIDRLFKDYPPIHEIRIVLKKPEAPVNGIFNYVGIELNRTRNDHKLPEPGQQSG